MICDLFCGIGWGQALHELGLTEHGIDRDPVVAETRALHGWATTTADITALNPADYPCEVLIASPPCQSFSAAGKRAGLDDPRGQLVWQVTRWALALRPRIAICEQVPAVLPIWRMICHQLDQWGYRSWCGVLDAVQWGVPQTRKRAILIARLDGSPLPPEPTHRPYRKGVGRGDGDPNLLPWVSMADALDLSGIINTRGDRGPNPAGGNEFGTEQPCWAMTGRARSWVVDLRQKPPGAEYGPGNITRPVDHPSPMFGTQSGTQWVLRERQASGAERPAGDPAMTISASADNGNFRFETPAETIRLTVAQALVLQSFPPDFVLAGTKTAQFRQIGNAVAPRFGRALLAHVLGITQEAVA